MVTAAETARPPITRRRAALLIATLSGGGIISALQQTLVMPVLSVAPQRYGVTADDASWLLTAVLLAGVVAPPVVTRLADLFGRRRMLVVTLALLVAGSIVAALPLSFGWVLVGRALQGSATALLPIGISILAEVLPRQRIALGIALMSATLAVGGAAGLPLSGLLFELSGFAGVFGVTAVLGAIALPVVLIVVPRTPPRAVGRFDWSGALVLSTALVSIMLVISKGTAWGWTSMPTLGLLGAGLVLLTIFGIMQARSTSPLIELGQLASRPVRWTNLATVLASMAMFANMLIATFELAIPAREGGPSLGVVETGLALLPIGAVSVVATPLVARMLNRLGARMTLCVGSALMAMGFAAHLATDHQLGWILVNSVVVAIGAAMAFAAMPLLVLRFAPAEDAATANGINSLMRFFGFAAASAILGVVAALPSAAGSLLDPLDIASAGACMIAVLAAVAALAIPRRRLLAGG
ncbi:Major Facilitator Superfamily protein [Agrococcus baldri]|uniref:Major Facilitator Superfamily protein n=1 Tax=Agrococcus baldri TaxID=153730 RepID=A0AA94HMQ7_9MICO|nr:MFS transporter [Agrococcus baldri]SFS11559.1 Major Facilitator Superfamily protein [Agrococcus baldri]